MKPDEGLKAVGANWIERVRFAALPQVLPNFVSYAMLRLEINVRASTIIGAVGGGGIGEELKLSISRGFGAKTIALVILLLITIIIVDQFSAWLRRKLVGDAAFLVHALRRCHDHRSDADHCRLEQRYPASVPPIASSSASRLLIAVVGGGALSRFMPSGSSRCRTVISEGKWERLGDLYAAVDQPTTSSADFRLEDDGDRAEISALFGAGRRSASRLADARMPMAALPWSSAARGQSVTLHQDDGDHHQCAGRSSMST